MNIINRELYHEFIINDLLLKSLEVDRQKLANFKLNYALVAWFERALEVTNSERKRIAASIHKEGIRFERLEKTDDLFTLFIFLDKGLEQQVKYSNYALRNQVNEAAKNLLGLDARSFDKSQ